MNTTTPIIDSVKPAAKRIVLGLTGGIAAYKAAELTRLLVKSGVVVTVVMTKSAEQFVTPVTMQALSGNKVFTDLWDREVPNNMAHITLTRDADLVVIAPATGDFLAKLACGLADDLLSTMCLARNVNTCPLLVAPAMNTEMWHNPATQRNIATLIADGVTIVGPSPGEQACGETGLGRMSEPAEIFALIMQRLIIKTPISAGVSKHLWLKKAVVTAGPTFEAIDAVRGITNASSGKMGYAIAAALRDQGATVTLITGPTALVAPIGVNVVRVTSAAEMLAAVNDNIDDVSLFFAVAAVADYTPVEPQKQKLKKSGNSINITLTPTVDILAAIAARKDAPFCVGFAAESENVVEYAAKKRLKKQIPMIVANDAATAIGADDNTVTIIDAAGETRIPRAPKSEVARKIVQHALNLLQTPLKPVNK